MLDKVLSLRSKTVKLLEKTRGVALLLLRLAVGLVFIQTGWGKVHNIDHVTEFFTSLHIPAPHFQATLVAWTELLGGTAIIIGLLTRLAAIPLSVTMVVATLTAVLPDVEDKTDLISKSEVTYLIIFLALILLGPGPLSLDHLLAKALDAKTKKPEKAPAAPAADGAVAPPPAV